MKYLQPREEGDEAQAWIPIKVSFGGKPPKLVVITSRGRNIIGEDMVEMLDWAEFVNVDLVFRPYNWEVNGKEGIKAYLKEFFVTIHESPLDLKYGDVPEVRARGGAVE